MLNRIIRQAGHRSPLGLIARACLVSALLAADDGTAIMAQSLHPASNHSLAEPWHFRYDLFQMLFEQNGLRPIQNVEDALGDPDKSVVVLLGNNQQLPPSELKRFVDQGGALLLASDRPFSLSQSFAIAAGPTIALSTDDSYQGHSDCIRISAIDSMHELTYGVKQLITNRSGWIVVRQNIDENDWRMVAHLPMTTLPFSSRSKPIVGSMEAKRLIVVADHSLFTNGMIWHGDNALLAINVSKALADQGRDQILFMVDGVATKSYLMGPLASQLPMPVPPNDYEPDLDLGQLVLAANRTVTAVQDSDGFNKLLLNRPRGVPPAYYRRGLLFALSGLLIALAVYRLAGKASKPVRGAASSKRNRPRILRHRSGIHRNGPQSTSLRNASPEQRGAVAQRLAQHFCREATASEVEAVWESELREFCDGSEQLSRVLAVARLSQPPHFSDAMLVDFARQVAKFKAQIDGKSSLRTHFSRQA